MRRAPCINYNLMMGDPKPVTVAEVTKFTIDQNILLFSRQSDIFVGVYRLPTAVLDRAAIDNLTLILEAWSENYDDYIVMVNRAYQSATKRTNFILHNGKWKSVAYNDISHMLDDYAGDLTRNKELVYRHLTVRRILGVILSAHNVLELTNTIISMRESGKTKPIKMPNSNFTY